MHPEAHAGAPVETMGIAGKKEQGMGAEIENSKIRQAGGLRAPRWCMCQKKSCQRTCSRRPRRCQRRSLVVNARRRLSAGRQSVASSSLRLCTRHKRIRASSVREGIGEGNLDGRLLRGRRLVDGGLGRRRALHRRLVMIGIVNERPRRPLIHLWSVVGCDAGRRGGGG